MTASFARVDGCIGTSIALFAAQELTRNNGTKTTSSEVILGITKIDVCNGSLVDDLLTLQSLVTFEGNTNSATLESVVVMQDALGDVVNVPVSLTLTGIGPTVHDNTHERIEQGNTRIHIHHNGRSRDAAAEGSIDGQDVAGTVGNVTLTTEKEATVTLIHN
jgi:hypothetical protein